MEGRQKEADRRVEEEREKIRRLRERVKKTRKSKKREGRKMLFGGGWKRGMRRRGV